MKKISLLALPFALSFALIACGGSKEDETKTDDQNTGESTEQTDNADNSGNPVDDAQAAAQKKIDARRAKGDTLAMHYEELEKYLPGDLAGYTRGEPTGASVNIPGASYSSAEVEYNNDKGDHVKVTLIDYNQAYAMYTGLTAMWATGFSVDTPEEKAGGVKLNDNVGGWEQFEKKSGDATVTLGVGYRFWVSVEANNQKDTEWAKSLAQKMDLKKLSEM